VYKIAYSSRAAKSLKKIPKQYQISIKSKIVRLSSNQRIPGTIKLVDYPVVEFRHCVSNYRILFDLNEANKIIEILDIRKRDEKTYS